MLLKWLMRLRKVGEMIDEAKNHPMLDKVPEMVQKSLKINIEVVELNRCFLPLNE